MGQKVNPLGIRLGIVRDWTSRWYAGKKQFPMQVHTDFRVREFLKEKLKVAHYAIDTTPGHAATETRARAVFRHLQLDLQALSEAI